MGDLLTGTRLGLIWLGRLALALILAWLLAPAMQSTETSGSSGTASHLDAASNTGNAWRDWAALAACLGLMLTASLTSHAAAESAPVIPILADFVHLAAVSAWVGGLAWFVSAVRESRPLEAGTQTGLVATLILHFSNLASVCVGVVVLSGVYTSLLRIGALTELVSTAYGLALLIKIGLALVLILLGGINLVLVSPRLRRSRDRGESNLPVLGRFRQVVTAEVVVGVIVLLSASLLSSLPPAHSSQVSTGLNGSARADDLLLRLSINPGRVGQNTFSLQVLKNGQPVVAVKEALLRMGPRKANLPPLEAQLIAQGDGTYQAVGSYLSLPDDWQVQAIVRRDTLYDAYAIFDFNLLNPSNPGEAQAQQTRFAGGLLAFSGLACLLALMALLPFGNLALRLAISFILPIILLALGAVFIFRTPSPALAELNPVSPGPQSIAAGQAIYTVRCLPCHGATGKGDGPIGQTLIPRPADLTQHAIPGVHTDFQLYQWINDGFPGGRMPSFKGVISSTDRWNLVNFIRTFAPK